MQVSRWSIALVIPIATATLFFVTRDRAASSHVEAPATPPPPSTITAGEPRIEMHDEAPAEPAPTFVRPAAVPDPPSLTTFDLASSPDEAAAVIHALAKTEGDRDEAARTLVRWLREETRRDTADARGNVPNLIEALGEIGGDLAESALLDALEDDRHDLPLKTLIVQQLGSARDPRAARAIGRFAAVAENAPVRDDFDAELRDEALAAADESGRLLTLTRR